MLGIRSCGFSRFLCCIVVAKDIRHNLTSDHHAVRRPVQRSLLWSSWRDAVSTDEKNMSVASAGRNVLWRSIGPIRSRTQFNETLLFVGFLPGGGDTGWGAVHCWMELCYPTLSSATVTLLCWSVLACVFLCSVTGCFYIADWFPYCWIMAFHGPFSTLKLKSGFWVWCPGGHFTHARLFSNSRPA